MPLAYCFSDMMNAATSRASLGRKGIPGIATVGFSRNAETIASLMPGFAAMAGKEIA